MIHKIMEKYKVLQNEDVYESRREEFINVPDSLRKLIGDGSAKVERGKTIGRSLPYGALKVSVTCSITLTCDQSKPGIKKAITSIDDLLDSIMVEDIDEIEDFIRSAQDETD